MKGFVCIVVYLIVYVTDYVIVYVIDYVIVYVIDYIIDTRPPGPWYRLLRKR